jgi:hypothetical protein
MRLLPPRTGLRAVLAGAALLLTWTAAPVSAQPLNQPRRAADVYAPRTPTAPPTSELRFSLSALGGYDDNVTQSGGGGGAPSALQPGYLGLFDGALGYRRARGSRYLSFDGAAGVTSYEGAGLGPSQRASGNVMAGTEFGRGYTLTAGQGLSFDATYGLETLAAFDGPLGQGELPTTASVEGVLRRKSWSTDSSVSLGRRWTTRDSTSVSYGFTRRAYIQADSEASHSQNVNASYSRQMNRTTSLNMGYAYAQGEYVGGVELEDVRPRGTHAVTTGLLFTRRVSPRRSLVVGFDGGATRVSSVTGADQTEYAYWSPTASVNARLDLSRTWTLSGNFGRTITTLDGLTADTFVSDTATISVGGSAGRRLQLVFSGGVASGRQGEDVIESSDFETYTGAAQAQVSILRNLSAMAQYVYYRYNLTSGSPLPTDFPAVFDRNGFRVGLTLSWPSPERLRRTP